jgi:hypothetical protein
MVTECDWAVGAAVGAGPTAAGTGTGAVPAGAGVLSVLAAARTAWLGAVS